METLLDDVDVATRAIAPRDRVTIVAESFGGAVAMSYALAFPERVERLVILNSFPHFTSRARLAAGYHLLRALPWGAMSVVRRVAARRMHSPHTTREELEEFHARMQATTRRGYLSRLSMIRKYDLRPRLPELQTPTLFLAADGDHLLPAVEHARVMASLAPNASLRVLEGHGHTCLIAPGLDLAAILDEWHREPLNF
jgi:3-oxoadipate enol-lactonase